MEEGTGQKKRGREGRNDDKGMGGGSDDGVMCCFRANCFCDSVTTSFNAIGYNKELIEAWANEAACHANVNGLFFSCVSSSFRLSLRTTIKQMCLTRLRPRGTHASLPLET